MDDEVGLINMNARIYDPYLGRFLSADPVLPDRFNMQAFNRYSYVLGNPLKYIDPTGNESEGVCQGEYCDPDPSVSTRPTCDFGNCTPGTTGQSLFDLAYGLALSGERWYAAQEYRRSQGLPNELDPVPPETAEPTPPDPPDEDDGDSGDQDNDEQDDNSIPCIDNVNCPPSSPPQQSDVLDDVVDTIGDIGTEAMRQAEALPGGKLGVGAIKAAGGAIVGAPKVVDKVKKVIKSIKDNGFKVKVNPRNAATKQEGNVTIDFGDKTKVNLRVETHPLSQGGAPIRHGNVEVTKQVKNKNKVTKNTQVVDSDG